MINIKGQKKIGNDFVMDVAFQLNYYLLHKSYYKQTSKVASETAKYIVNEFPNYSKILSKFDHPYPDNKPDLEITINGQVVNVNLFHIKGRGKVQQKNLGALSFLEKYFESKSLQEKFNEFYETIYNSYLESIHKLIFKGYSYTKKINLKAELRPYLEELKSEEVLFHRRKFLFLLRECAFDLFKNEYNLESPSIHNAFRTLMLLDDINIVGRTLSNDKIEIETVNPILDFRNNIELFKKGNDSVEIAVGNVSLILRFKFESNPLSSIKLATSYAEDRQVSQDKNINYLKSFEKVLSRHSHIKDKNISNAIGKCNEAIIYHKFIQMDSSIVQVDDETSLKMIENYMNRVSEKNINDLQKSAKVTQEKIIEFLDGKYPNNTITSIQLVPESYLEDRLNNSDMKLILYYNSKYIEEDISLKAIKNKNSKITVKNPGAGTILESQYFDAGSLRPLIAETKSLYEQKKLNHMDSLEKVSEQMGEYLSNVPNHHLEKGLKAILGSNILAVTFYGMNSAIVLEHEEIKTKIIILKQTPTKIQTTLVWNNSLEELTMRMKFSGSQSKGWTSLKLACEYQIKS